MPSRSFLTVHIFFISAAVGSPAGEGYNRLRWDLIYLRNSLTADFAGWDWGLTNGEKGRIISLYQGRKPVTQEATPPPQNRKAEK